MAEIDSILRTLIDKDDVRQWAAVNNTELVEEGEYIFRVGDFAVIFDEYGKVAAVERRAEHDEPTAL
ncbi:hypothetical protein SEA_BILLNYE_7 [Streptomyces phage BillNye]|uniref:Uncharacterized protein n=1 Tax=Streptomyces phage BillNye TaxID=2079426 RepID=A0A2L1IVL2_9CAUD|nr:hypothetical protein FDJ30_gp007 [Streptomyces phage BillNye]AVD99212.1 hypothetical protein SEA_BILLNYE_7 [Streptomyces phage BillNye]